MTNKIAIYLLFIALVLAALTNRWFLRGSSSAAFSIVSFDGLFFTAQWIACATTAVGVAPLAAQWRATGQFPKPVLLGAAMMFYFAATGIPQTLNSYDWAAGDVGLARWLGLIGEHRQAGDIAPRFAGVWKSEMRTYTIKRDELTIHTEGKTETLAASTGGCTFAFRYATDATFHSNPVAESYYKILEGPLVPVFEAACPGRLYTFLLRTGDSAIAFRDLHERNPGIETLVRIR